MIPTTCFYGELTEIIPELSPNTLLICSALSFKVNRGPVKRSREIKFCHSFRISWQSIFSVYLDFLLGYISMSLFMFETWNVFVKCAAQLLNNVFEPPRDKTNKMTVRPAKSQINLRIRPVWSESSLCTQWVAKDPSLQCGQRRVWSDWVDAQADLSLRWAHIPFCWFCHEAAHFIYWH